MSYDIPDKVKLRFDPIQIEGLSDFMFRDVNAENTRSKTTEVEDKND